MPGDLVRVARRVEAVPYELRGQWIAKAAPWGADGYVAELSFPLPDDEHALTITAAVSPGLVRRVLESGLMYQSEVSGYGFEEPGTIYLPNGLPLSPSWEVGLELAPILGAVGGVIGTAVGGPAGTALGGALGSLAGSAIGAATADPTRPASLPPVGSQANRSRILSFLQITPGEDASSVRAKLIDGTHRGWDPGDLADAAVMLARVPPSGPVDLAVLTAPSPEGGTMPGGNQQDGLGGLQIAPQIAPHLAQQVAQQVAPVAQQVAPGLTSMLGAATSSPGDAGNAPAALIAGARALLGQQGAAADLSSMYGANAPAVLDLTRRALRGMDATAASLTNDPVALDIVRRSRQAQESHIANVWNLVDSLTRFARTAGVGA